MDNNQNPEIIEPQTSFEKLESFYEKNKPFLVPFGTIFILLVVFFALFFIMIL